MTDSALNKAPNLGVKEWLRFSDFVGRSNLRQFWTYVGFAIPAVLLFEAVASSLSGLGWSTGAMVASLVATVIEIFLVVPTIAAIARRIQDTRFARDIGNRIPQLTNRPGVNVAILTVLAIAISVVTFRYLGFIVLLFPFLLTLLPSDDRRKSAPRTFAPPPTYASHLAGSPPPPPGLPTGVVRLPTSTSGPISGSIAAEPKKKLLLRFWFWITIVLAILFIILSLWPGLPGKFVSGWNDRLDTIFNPTPLPTRTVTPSPIPTETEAPLPTPTATDESGAGVGAGAGDNDDDDDGAVVVVPPSDSLDPRFRYCSHAIGAGYGPYYAGKDPEYEWYNDRDGDGIVCER